MEINELSEFQRTLISDTKENIIHGICVSNLTYHIAREMGLDEDICYELAIAGIFHDIGKLQLSRYLYGRAEESFQMEGIKYMRMHSKLSYDIIQYYDLSAFILQSVLYHHENYDGSGYPDNLKGEDIPFGARILRVADTFSALISDRPYRKAFDVDTAIQIMIDEINFYDMEVFLAFQKAIHTPEIRDSIINNKSVVNMDDIINIFKGE